MAKNKIKKNLNQIIKSAMHRPLSSTGYVLYPKVEGCTNSDEGETQAEKDPHYIAQSKSNYNSPTNIRKLFITGDSVTIQYYTPMITKSNNGTHQKSVSYKPEDNLFKIAASMLNYSQSYSQYLMEKTINAKAVEPDNYVVTGNGLGVISNPWVCSNIEEIYFDWTILLSQDVQPYFNGLCSYKDLYNFLSKTAKPDEIKTEQIIKYFSAFNSGGIKDLRKRYPRLRTIAMISNLKDVMEHPQMKMVDLKFANIEESKMTWYEVNKKLVAASNSVVYLGDLTNNIPRLNTEFTVKSSIYKFDSDKLNGKVERFKTLIADYKRQKEYGGSTDSKEDEEELNLEAPNLETQLLEIESKYGAKTLKNVLIYAVNGSELKTTELKNLLRQFTKPNRQRLASLIGLKID